jgi:hypothetical protein
VAAVDSLIIQTTLMAEMIPASSVASCCESLKYAGTATTAFNFKELSSGE